MKYAAIYFIVGALFGLNVADHRKAHQYFANAVAGALLGVPMIVATVADQVAADTAVRLDKK